MPGFFPLSSTPLSSLPAGAVGSLVLSGLVDLGATYRYLPPPARLGLGGQADTPCFEGGVSGLLSGVTGSALQGPLVAHLAAGGKLLVGGTLPGWPEGVVAALSGVANFQIGYQVFAAGRLTLSGVLSTQYSPAYRPTGKLTLSGTPGLRATYRYLPGGKIRFTGRADVSWKAFTANQIVFIDLGPVRADLSVITTTTYVDVTPINIVIRRDGATVSGGSVTVTQPTVTVVPNPLEVEVPVAIRYHPPR